MSNLAFLLILFAPLMLAVALVAAVETPKRVIETPHKPARIKYGARRELERRRGRLTWS